MHFKVHSRYFYSKLNDNEKKIYNKTLEAWLDYKEKTTISGVDRSADLDQVLLSLRNDNPELFYVNFESVVVGFIPDGLTVSAKMLYSPAQCEQFKSTISNVISKVSKELKPGIEKAKVVHDYLTCNVKYAEDIHATEAHTIKGALIDGCAVCDGFARAFKLLCDAIEVPCIFINGTATNSSGTTEKHAWNIVRVNNKNYHVDVTWDCLSGGLSGFSLYYNVPDAFISKNHVWQDGFWPKCSDYSEINKFITPVTGKKSFGELLSRMSKTKTPVFAVSFNKKFNSDREILDIIQKIALFKLLRIKSVSLTYQQDLDCAVIWLSY